VVGDQPFAVVGQSFGGQIARAVSAHFGTQVRGAALLAPVVRWGEDRTLPSETIVARDDAFLSGLPPEGRDLFALVAARLDRPGFARITEHLLPGWRARDRNAAAELEANFLLPRWPERDAAPQPVHTC
jgi:pimeloyl-ACP methyl ester carboxylesterase